MTVGEDLVGNVIVFTGGGKGKTTAALGLACRALGHAGRATFIHFTGPTRPSLGEVHSAKALSPMLRMIAIESQASDEDYLDQFDEAVETVEAALDRAEELLAGEQCNLLVLDDINPLLDEGIVQEARMGELLAGKPKLASVVFTGRFAPAWLTELADIVTDFAEVKHPAHSGVGPRKGIEY